MDWIILQWIGATLLFFGGYLFGHSLGYDKGHIIGYDHGWDDKDNEIL